MPDPDIDATLYRFLVELQFGVHTTLHRDIMGPSFSPRVLEMTYSPHADMKSEANVFGCPLVFGQAENKFVFDRKRLDDVPELGNRITYTWVVALCDQLLDELALRVGIAGKVREFLLVNIARPTSFDAVARHLKMTTRTLRRKLRDENTSFRDILSELKAQVAIKYLRDTELTIDDVAASLGFSDAANFRHAFRRWTKSAPNDFRNIGQEAGDDQSRRQSSFGRQRHLR